MPVTTYTQQELKVQRLVRVQKLLKTSLPLPVHAAAGIYSTATCFASFNSTVAIERYIVAAVSTIASDDGTELYRS